MVEGKKLNPMLIGKVTEDVKHQSIGGKRIILERIFSSDELLELTIDKMNIACINFLLRRPLLKHGMKVYYGHVNGLGYFVAQDELVGIVRSATYEEIREVW